MTTSSLTLIPYGKQSFTIRLLENDGRQGSVEGIIECSAERKSLFSDLSYEFLLNHENLSAVEDVRVYINDTYEPSTFNNGRICFPARGANDKRVFLDCYGFVEINLKIVMNDGTEQNLTSEYLPVLVRRGQLNESVKAMVSYVYTHQDSLLLNGEPKPRNVAGLKESGYKSLAAQIILAEEIASLYETCYGYFKANSRFHIEKVAVVDRLERLQSVTPVTLQYIATHPEHLKSVTSNVGVRRGNQIYHPEKTLSLQNVNSYDIYENRVVLSFLQKMVADVADLRNRCKQLLQQIPNDEEYSADYIYSSFFMFSETRKMLEKGMNQLSKLFDKFTQLWGMYRSALSISDKMLKQMQDIPHATAIFMSVPQYNRIFMRIHQWFSFGIYDFSKENYMLSFIKISSLYESYLLVKMIEYFKQSGYTLHESKQCNYPVARNWKYKNTRCLNTFSFVNNHHKIVLYYQPVIFDTDQSRVNGVGLYRNNSIPTFTGEEDDNRQGGHYYVPDYLLKVEDASTTKYLIIDAKFSDIVSVRRYYIKDLAFKYLFSISPIHASDTVAGLCIAYGKCTGDDQVKSAYDKQLPGNQIVPFAETLPLIEGVSVEEHCNKLDLLFKKVLS